MGANTSVNLLRATGEDAARLLSRHLETSRLWYPHEQIDWGAGESFKERPWTASDYPLDGGVRSAIFLNLLTEDNIPFYTSTLLSLSGSRDHPISVWNRQWTAEEFRHSMMMRDWVHVSRCIDPVALEDARRIQMSRGEVPSPETFADMLCYVTMQERATGIAHRNTMSKLSHDDKMGRSVLGLIAGDEVRHFNFYRDMALAGFREDPTTMMVAARRQVEAFAMPGTGIPGFTRHAVRVSRAGIYGMDQFINGVVAPVLVAWDIEHIEGLSKDGEIARTELFAFMDSVKERVVAQSAKSERQQGESPL